MDLYSVDSATSFGNQVGQGVQSENRFRESQNQFAVGQATQTLINDTKSKGENVDVKGAVDAQSLIELPGNVSRIADVSRDVGLVSQSGKNVASAGASVARTGRRVAQGARTVRSVATGGSAADVASDGIRAGAAPLFSTGPGAGRPLSVVAGTAAPADVALSSSEDVAEGAATLGKGLDAETLAFKGVGQAGGPARFLLNRVGGVTSELGLEVGGKALGAAGGIFSAGEDAYNLATTGHVFSKGEHVSSEIGNIGSMAGAALDIASIALPVLAPLAIAVNIGSAIFGTVGSVQDEDSTVSGDQKTQVKDETGKNIPLAIHPAWSSVGMVASVHSQPSIS